VRDGASTIGEQLAALAAQTYPGAFDVVVADNGSTDDTRAVVESWSERLPRVVVVDATGRRGAGYARGVGAEAATGDFLAFCDADDVVAPEWLAALAESAREHDIVTGVLDATELNAEAVRRWRPERARSIPRAGFLPFAPSGNFGVWADVFRATGGFDERYLQNEDVEWSWRAQLASYTLGFAPDAVVHYRYRTGARGIAREGFGRGLCTVRLYRDFRARGMRRPPTGRSARRWLWLVVRAPYVLSSDRRGLWVRRAGESAGRLVGSVRFRVWCP